jgi:hypothetical protein
VPLFGSSNFQRFAALCLRQVFYAPPQCHSPIATFLSDALARSRPSLLRLIILLFVLCFSLVSLFFFFFFLCIIFVLIFLCFLFLLGFIVFALVFPYIASLCLFCVFFGFYNSADLLCACFAALCPLSGIFPRSHRVKLPTCHSMFGVCLHAIGFISLFFYFLFLLVISVSISLLLSVMLGLDLWVVDVNIILTFRSRRTNVDLGFLAVNVKE